ncbi:putative holin-like toxin [Furfurilactobacillus rossiae]|uniref:Putative holin-like toxin n=1 Tax=Furfurilactobacillus milii TaxID=2888272 RepID=A0A6N9I451_9LACO|nr:putative holin-like toxin [Furfurilactobacillus milii]
MEGGATLSCGNAIMMMLTFGMFILALLTFILILIWSFGQRKNR